MARILRGEIRWAELNQVRGNEQAGLRPVLILSHEVFNERSGTVIAVALTSQPQRAEFPSHSNSNPKTFRKNHGSKSAKSGRWWLSESASGSERRAMKS